MTKPVELSQQLISAATCLRQVQQGQSLTAALEAVHTSLRPGVQALCFSALRNWGFALQQRQALVQRTPTPALDALLCLCLALLPQGLYSPHTLVSQAVEAAKAQPKLRALSGFLNAVLRQALRNSEINPAPDAQTLALLNYPDWWIQQLKTDYPQHWRDVATAGGAKAPMVLRVNTAKISLSDYAQRLFEIGVEAQLITDAAGISALTGEKPLAALRLNRAVPVNQLPGFAEGLVSVQDLAAQFAAHLLLANALRHSGNSNGAPLRVLDACAAPGGKTAHVLEMAKATGLEVALTALDIDAARCERVRSNLQRLGLRAHVLCADAAKPQDWLVHAGDNPFDLVLLDAPCSASGIVRRHPDVPWLRRKSDITVLAQTQDKLLAALWPLLRRGGRLLYCTCSVFHAEGQARIQAFLKRNSNAMVLPSLGHLQPFHWPEDTKIAENLTRDYDGFFYALLEKK